VILSSWTPTQMLVRALVAVPIVLFAVALVPSVLLFPVLTASQSRRVLTFVGQLRAWHSEVLKEVTRG
jgi:hypothetical protein